MKSGQTFCFGYPLCCSGESVSITDVGRVARRRGASRMHSWNALLGEGRLCPTERLAVRSNGSNMAYWHYYKLIPLSLPRWPESTAEACLLWRSLGFWNGVMLNPCNRESRKNGN